MTTVVKTVPIQLDLSRKYIVRVRTVNSFGVSSSWSEGLLVAVNDSIPTLDPLTGFSVIPALDSLIVHWNVTDDMSKYEIFAMPGSTNFDPSPSNLVGVVTQSNTFIFSSTYVEGSGWTALRGGDTYVLRMRYTDSLGNTSAYTLPIAATVGDVDNLNIISQSIRAEEGIYPKIYILNEASTPTTAIPGDLWIQSDVIIPAVTTQVAPMAPNPVTVSDQTLDDGTGPTTVDITWPGLWVTDNAVQKIYIYRAVGNQISILNSINSPSNTVLDRFLADTISYPDESGTWTDVHAVDATPLAYKIVGSPDSGSTRPNGIPSLLTSVASGTKNGKPRNIGSITTTPKVDSVIVTIAAPPFWYDPALTANYEYELTDNNASTSVTGTWHSADATPIFTIPSLQETNPYTLVVNAIDLGGPPLNAPLRSATVTRSFTTASAAPNIPLTLVESSVTAVSATLTWTVSPEDAVGNNHYELTELSPTPSDIDINILPVDNTQTTISYNLTGLTNGTTYTFRVRSVAKAIDDITLGPGDYSGYKSVTFDTLADSDPPPVPIINWFRPHYLGVVPLTSDYGVMYANVTWPADALSNPITVTVQRKVDSGAWETIHNNVAVASVPNPILISPTISTGYLAGQTIQIKVWSEDTVPNSNEANAVTASYTLTTSPTLISATFTSQYNAKWKWNGTNYDADYRYAPAQGYNSAQASTYDMTGVWGYTGSTTSVTRFEEQLANKTIVSATIWLKTSAASNSSAKNVSLILHDKITKPGSTGSAPAKTGATGAGTLAVGTAKELPLQTSWVELLKDGTYKGVGVFLETGKTSNWAWYYNISGTTAHVDSKSGRVTVYHLG